MIEEIKELIDEDCSITSGDLVLYVRRHFNLHVCLSTIDRAIGSFNYSVKRITHRAIAGDTPANEQARLDFCNWYLDQQAAGRTMVMFDEVPFNLSMRVAYGRSEVGTRAEDRVPKIKSKNVTVMAAMYTRGVLLQSILPGNGNRIECEHFIDDLAAARDAAGLPNNTIVILDNVSFHHSANVIEMLELRGFEYKFLPPYTPYFMAIECMFAEWKTFVKRGLANTRAMTQVELEDRMNAFRLAPDHALHYVAHAGRNILQYTRGVRVFDN